MFGILMQEDNQDNTIYDTDNTEPVEGQTPGEHGSQDGTKASDSLPHIEARHMNTYGQAARLAFVPVGDQGKCGRNIKGFADSHQGAKRIKRTEVFSITHQEGNSRPDDQRTDDQPLAAEAVSHHAGERTQDGIDPEKHGHQRAESLGFLQFHDVGFHGFLHGGEHLPVHVIQESDNPEKADDHPRISFCIFESFEHDQHSFPTNLNLNFKSSRIIMKNLQKNFAN